MSKLIVIEGVDSSGKETQAKLLCERLKNDGMDTKLISFPDYESEFSVPVKRYLAGDLGARPDEINPYASSLLYAIDRFASFTRNWGSFYSAGGTIVADRYVTSNIVHQASKLSGTLKDEFINWLSDLEYDRLRLPRPDIVIFLDMPPEYAQKLMAKRKNKITGSDKKDIHENDGAYLVKSYNNAVSIAGKLGWYKVQCVTDHQIREISDIAEEIYQKVKIIS